MLGRAGRRLRRRRDPIAGLVEMEEKAMELYDHVNDPSLRGWSMSGILPAQHRTVDECRGI